jgi:hypothetical protein
MGEADSPLLILPFANLWGSKRCPEATRLLQQRRVDVRFVADSPRERFRSADIRRNGKKRLTPYLPCGRSSAALPEGGLRDKVAKPP